MSRQISTATDLPVASEEDPHWSDEEVASFAHHPGIGRILNVRPGTRERTAVEVCLRDAGYCLGRLPVTRDPSHLPQAAATFMPDVIYLTLTPPLSMCLDALEALAGDPKTREVPLVALVPEYAASKVIEEAYTRSGCDFFRIGGTQVELLARTHLLVRLRAACRGSEAATGEPAMPQAANAPSGDRLDLRDPATGVYTPTYFRHRLPTETARAHRYQRDLSLVGVRVGPDASDETALKVARVLRECCRDVDLVARLERDLFVVLLPETDAAGADSFVARARTDLQAGAVRHYTGRAALGADNVHSGSELLRLAASRADG